LWNGHPDFHNQLSDGEVSVCDTLALLTLIREAELLSGECFSFVFSAKAAGGCSRGETG